MTKRFPATVAAALAAVAALATQAQPQAPVREITKLAGEVYRFRNNNHYSVFAVTPAGVIATDPINAEAARWLKDEIRKRFAQPVRYLVYSHDHADHISGGEVFADTAVDAAHANAKRTIVAEKRPTAGPQVTFASEMSIELGVLVVELAFVGRNQSDYSIVMRFSKDRLHVTMYFITLVSLAFWNIAH